jgi:hypothetical protein
MKDGLQVIKMALLAGCVLAAAVVPPALVMMALALIAQWMGFQ